MPSRRFRLAVVALALLAPAWAAAADGALSQAYAAILRGDYDSGQTSVSQAMTAGEPRARQTADWLDAYRTVMASRSELKTKTLEWNSEQARKALAEAKALESDSDPSRQAQGEESTRLALSFASQAAPYADDLAVFTAQDWVQELTRLAKAKAQQAETADDWSAAVSYAMLLERLYPKDAELKAQRERAMRHARLELVYEDEKALREHTRSVTPEMLRDAVKTISRMYWQPPDFRKAARGGLDNVETLCGTRKLYKFLDGLANPLDRDYFLGKLRSLRTDLEAAKSYDHKDVQALFSEILAANKISVQLPEELLVAEFIEGASPELDDYTSVVWPSEAKDFDKIMMGGFEGVGIQLGVDERWKRLKVVTPLEKSPALEAGVQPDDLIIAVNGESTKGWTTEDAVRNIMGPAGSEVALTIRRPSTGKNIVFKLQRRNIALTSVRGVQRVPGSHGDWDYMLDKDTGVAYIRLTNFLPGSQEELVKALTEARTQGMTGLILDVRYNPGGLLDVAVAIVSNFLESGEVVSTRGRNESESHETVNGKADWKNIPLVVLVNEQSASASEILAGALQDYGRAVVLGERTFGKGSVQHIRPLGADAKLKLTTALYYLPSGRSPHKLPDAERWGVDPDVEVKLTPKEFRRVVERERDRDVIHNEVPPEAGQELTPEEQEQSLADLEGEESDDDEDKPFLTEDQIKLLESDPNEAPKNDPQLETALLLIRVKLAANVPWPPELARADLKPSTQK